MPDDTFATAIYSPFFAYAGITMAIGLSAIGACLGTAKSAMAIAGMGPTRPHLVMSSVLPVVMAGILTIYGLITSILISGNVPLSSPFSRKMSKVIPRSFMYLASGLSTGLTSIASGYTIGVVGEAGVRAYMQQQRLYTGLVVILIFSEVLALYGLILSIMMTSSGSNM